LIGNVNLAMWPDIDSGDIGIFANNDAIIRLVGVAMLEIHHQWAVARRFTATEPRLPECIAVKMPTIILVLGIVSAARETMPRGNSLDTTVASIQVLERAGDLHRPPLRRAGQRRMPSVISTSCNSSRRLYIEIRRGRCHSLSDIPELPSGLR